MGRPNISVPENARTRVSARLRPRTGATAVEFALVGPILFIMVLSIIEFGRAFMVTEVLTDAARRGCRQGILQGTTTQQIKDTATNYLQSVGISGTTVSVVINDGAGNIVEAQNVPSGSELTVQVQVPFNSVTWVPVNMKIYVPGAGTVNLGPSGNLNGQFTMRRE